MSPTLSGLRLNRDTAPVIAAVDAQSAKITLSKADQNGNDIILIATRDTSMNAPEPQTYYPPTFVKVGKRDVKAVFLGKSNNALAEIDTTVTVTEAGGVLNLTTSQQPDLIVVTPGQSVPVKLDQDLYPKSGDSAAQAQDHMPTHLQFVAYLGTGTNQSVVAVNPLSVNISIPDGASYLKVVPRDQTVNSPQDSLQGLQSGTASVRVQVGTTTSDPAPITVYSSTHVVIDPQQLGQNGDVTSNIAYKFTATVTPPTDASPLNTTLNAIAHNSNLDVTWSIRESNQGRIVVDANNPNVAQYIPPAKSGVYHLIATSVFDKGISAVATVKVSLGSLDISFQP